MIDIIETDLIAGQPREYALNASYFEILDATYPFDVVLTDRNGTLASSMKNGEASFFLRPREGFARIIITSAQAQRVRFFVGSGDAGTRRAAGNVSVIDTARNLVLADTSYWTNVYSGLAPAGQLPHCAVWNPAASTKNLSVVLTNVASTVTMQCSMRALSVQPAAGWTAVTPQNRNIGSLATPQGQLWFTSNAVAQGAATMLPGRSIVANASQDIVRPRSPFVLKPGNGLVLVGGNTASDLAAIFDVEEF